MQSSSVMDLLAESADGLMLNPGPYDIAALRFAYGNQIEVTSQTQENNIKKSSPIDQLFSQSGNLFYSGKRVTSFQKGR